MIKSIVAGMVLALGISITMGSQVVTKQSSPAVTNMDNVQSDAVVATQSIAPGVRVFVATDVKSLKSGTDILTPNDHIFVPLNMAGYARMPVRIEVARGNVHSQTTARTYYTTDIADANWLIVPVTRGASDPYFRVYNADTYELLLPPTRINDLPSMPFFSGAMRGFMRKD